VRGHFRGLLASSLDADFVNGQSAHQPVNLPAGGGDLAFPSFPSCLGGEKGDYHKVTKSTKVMVLFRPGTHSEGLASINAD